MTDDERKKGQNERKAKSRAKQEAHDKECGKEVLSLEFTAYRGTLAQIERLKAAGGFDDVSELITIMIRNADKFCDQDMQELLKV